MTTANEECDLLLRSFFFFFFVGVRLVLVRKANETREHGSVHGRSNALGGKCVAWTMNLRGFLECV